MNYEIIVDELTGIEHIVIDLGNDAFTSMTKAHYDELQAQEENGTIS